MAEATTDRLRIGRWESLEQWSPTLFLVGGLLLLGFAGSFAYMAVTGADVPQNLFSGLGLTLCFLGLLGLYPGVADRSPWLARVGAVLAVLGAVAFAAVFVRNVASIAGLTQSVSLGPLQLFNVVGLSFGFLVFGVATLRSGAYSRTVGLLLLAPSVIFYVNLVRLLIFEMEAFAVSSVLALGQALAMLAIGYSLHKEGVATTRATSASDSTA